MSQLELLEGAPNEIVMRREFDAPRRLVVKAMTTPDLLKRWLGNSRAEVVSVECDLRVGGAYRQEFRRRGDGQSFAFRGTFVEIAEERMVQRESFEGQPGESIITTTWTEAAGKTTMRVVMAFESKAVRDFVVKTGMADGADESYDGLDAVLVAM